VDVCQGAASRALLLLGLSVLPSLRLGEDAASGDENDVLAAELLLELTNETGLDLLVLLQLGHRHVDDDALPVRDLDLLGPNEEQLPKLGLDV